MADLVNLRRLLQSLFALFSAADFALVWGEVPALLAAMGVSAASGAPVSAGLIAPALDLVFKVLEAARPYRFGYDDQLLRRIVENNLSQFGEAKDIRFPHHIVFINRTAAGHYGNLSRLRAAAPWRQMVEARLS